MNEEDVMAIAPNEKTTIYVGLETVPDGLCCSASVIKDADTR